MRLHTCWLMLLSAPLLFAATIADAQRDPAADVSSSSTVVVRVQAPDGGPFEEIAEVEFSSPGEPTPYRKFTRASGEAEFENVSAGTYSVTVIARGYKSGREDLEVTGLGGDVQVWIRLERDSGTAPSANASIGFVLAPKVQKTMAKGLGDLRTGKRQEAQKEFEAAYKLAPGNPDVNFFLGYTLLQEKDLDGAQTYLQRATSIDPHNISAWVALGQLRLQQGSLSEAATALEHAISLDAENWMAHWSLAATYLKDQKYEQARTEADAAVRAGKGAANAAEIIVGESWLAAGDGGKAIEAFEAFLRDAPGSPAAPAAKGLIAKLEAEKEAEDSRAIATASPAKSTGYLAPRAAPTEVSSGSELLPGFGTAESNLALPSWAPSSVDAFRPAVSSSATCSLPAVLEKTGRKIEEFVTNVGNIDATEELVHEELNELGKPTEKHKQRYDYMVNVATTRFGDIKMDERRNSVTGSAVFPDGIGSSGLPSIVLVFHPFIRDDYQMTCEGLGDWRGRPAWIVYFRQRDERPGRVSAYAVNGVMHTVSLKGRAWITADSFQIAHLETDMVKPMPEIQLVLQHISVDYKPVQFQARGEDVWLPANADLYFEFMKHRFHRLDTYSHYRLFSVDSTQKDKPPSVGGANKDDVRTGRDTP